MNGQTRAWLSTTVLSLFLLLTGITGLQFRPGVEQANEIADTFSLTLDGNQRAALDKAMHDGAKRALLHTERMVTAELTHRLEREPAKLAAKAEQAYRKRG
jgi:hypothetical protein